MEERSKGRDESEDQAMDIEAGLDVITILALRFMRNMGRGFDLLWEEALGGGPVKPRDSSSRGFNPTRTTRRSTRTSSERGGRITKDRIGR